MGDSETSNVRGYVVGPGQGVAGFGPEVKASRAATAGAITVIESCTAGGAPMHVHSNADECFYVIDGTISVRCGEDFFEAGPRSFVFLPRGIPHSWDVLGTQRATILMITVPVMLEEFLRDYHSAASMPNSEKDENS